MKATNAKHHARVIFRVWKMRGSERIAGGGVIALFPDERWDKDGLHCSSYQHIGQHGGATYHHVMSNTRPATPEEYKELESELETIGYSLLVVSKR